MSKVYTEYFQKSKVFLYPLLKLRRGMKYVPAQTYCGWNNIYEAEDMMFLCLYNTKLSRSFERFANKYLKENPHFRGFLSLESNKQLFIFDFSKYKSDWFRFLDGKYSQYSLNSKINILDYFDDESTLNYIKGFLAPEDVHEEYASNLNIDIDIVKAVHEVCTAPEMEKEILIDNNYILYQLLKESSIYLTNK
tara:strand:- start:2035 stop:2613 length:579 start_codon:yes stop_codon:yes gene_type:complete